MTCVCGKSHTVAPSLGGRLARYAKAVVGHAAGGFRVRDDAEVERILREHCQPCRYHDAGVCRHGRCGCRVNANGSALSNKIRMASQSCPIGYWGPNARPAGEVRVLLVTPGLRDAGAERWVTWMTRACDPSAVRVEAVIQTSGRDRTDVSLSREITQTCRIYHDGEAPDSVIGGADVALVWGVGRLPGSLRRLAAREVFVNHSSTPRGASVAQRAHAGGCHMFVAVSEAAAEYVSESYGCSVICNGVDLTRCDPSKSRRRVKRRWGVRRGERLVGFVGRPHADKHPETAAAACNLLPDHRPVFVGRYQDHERRRLLEVCGRSVFAGQYARIGDALQCLDCFVLVSDHEAMNLATCEAWAAGVPVVTTAVGAVPELEREHGRMAVTVPIGASAREVADAVLYATSGDNQQTVERAASVVREHYSLEAMGRRWTTYLLAARKAVRR